MRISDWSSHVCSSDLPRIRQLWSCRGRLRLDGNGQAARGFDPRDRRRGAYRRRRIRADPRSVERGRRARAGDRKSVVQGQKVSVRVDLGGSRIMKKKNTELHTIKVSKSTYTRTLQ